MVVLGTACMTVAGGHSRLDLELLESLAHSHLLPTAQLLGFLSQRVELLSLHRWLPWLPFLGTV